MIDSAVLRRFDAQLQGHVILPGDPDYESARKPNNWNPLTDKYPAVIVRCADAIDVVRAIAFSQNRHLEVAVRGGGHDILGMSVCEGGLVIDLGGMKRVEVDRHARLAWADAGLTAGELNAATAPFGLAAVLGSSAAPGIAGVTLGGGIGWLAGKYGAASDNVVSVELVTADGRRLTASDETNSHLFWGVRGGGGNFGVVTRFAYRLQEVPEVLGGMLYFSGTQVREFYQHLPEILRTSPDELTVETLLSNSDLSVLVCYCGDVARGNQVVNCLRSLARPMIDTIRLRSYAGLRDLDVEPMPIIQGRASRVMRQFKSTVRPWIPTWIRRKAWEPAKYWKGGYVQQVSEALIDTVFEMVADGVPSWWMVSLSLFVHGALCRRPSDATAFNLREQGGCTYFFGANWGDPAEADAAIAWARRSWAALQPLSGGRNYVNYLSENDEAAVRSAYGVNYPRLVALKNEYDPTNVFHLNRNIRPTV